MMGPGMGLNVYVTKLLDSLLLCLLKAWAFLFAVVVLTFIINSHSMPNSLKC